MPRYLLEIAGDPPYGYGLLAKAGIQSIAGTGVNFWARLLAGSEEQARGRVEAALEESELGRYEVVDVRREGAA